MSISIPAPHLKSPGTYLALGGIWAYQRFLSPYKGFSCAHRVLHGGPGCSGYAKQAIGEHGLISAVPMIRKRFRDCGSAYDTLVESRGDDEDEKKRRQRRKDRDDNCGCCADGSWLGLESVYLCGSVFRGCGSAKRGKGGADCCDPTDCGPCDLS